MSGPGLRERVVGCVLGLALGDALGAPFEFRRAHEIPDPLPAFELGWMGLPPGSTTDVTAMAMTLVRSLADRGELDGVDVAARHVAWFRTDPPDVGAQTRRVLARAAAGAPAEEAARAEWERRGPEVSAGNGSVMYCPPLGAAYAGRREALAEAAPRLSAITHYDRRCGTAVLAVTLTAAGLVRGEAARRSVVDAVAAVLDLEGGEELEFLVDAAGVTRPVDGPDRGFCLFAAAIGLQAVARVDEAGFDAGSVERELRRVVSLGGDTDTTAAVAGGLLGAAGGVGALPDAWLLRLQGRNEIEREAGHLVPLAERTE